MFKKNDMLLALIFSLLTTLTECSPVTRDVTKANAEAAYHQLQIWYSTDTGLWQNQWWQSGNAVTTIANLAAIDTTVKSDVIKVMSNTFTKAQVMADGFLNAYYDDEGWWALAWIAVYDVTGTAKYLSMAESIFADMNKVFGKTNCSFNSGGKGGIWWDRSQTYVNAIANELFFSVAANLATRLPSKPSYLSIAKKQWSWFHASGMINSNDLLNDGLTGTCKNNDGVVWSYNQGVLLGGLVALSQSTRDMSYITTAQTIADAAIAALAPNGILHESCEAQKSCDGDQTQFKGIFVRNLMVLQKASPQSRYAAFLDTNAGSIWSKGRNGNKLGLDWDGPFVGPADMSTQSSGMDCLVGSLGT